MEAKELRIGNYVYNDKKEFYTINWINESIKVKPIPLTEEWLLKFGFNYIDDDSEYLALKYRGFYIHSDDSDNFSIATIKVQDYRITIKHVHQLQNLYFALTNEELTKE
jgi:hypothetical protein